jgi:rhamnose transport system substrate-binding protein
MRLGNHERGLLLLLLIETAIFSFTGSNFLTWTNGGELIRLAVDLGLLTLALTIVIITGGIDLSVGSMMGLSAVVFGFLSQDVALPLWLSAGCVLAVGAAGGFLNGFVITRLNQLPLIVTLATFSLFRGLAEGMTGAVRSYAGFPDSFLVLGQGRLLDVIPFQSLIFAPAIFMYWLLLHRSVIGRGLYTIGHSIEGARYSGVPVRRNLRLVYTLSGLTASLAAIVYVSRLGQAKSDAGTGYELMAITAVVLGGTSIFGGRGTIGGTLLGLASLVVLQNGLRLSALPTELAGILTGVLLITAIALDRWRSQSGVTVSQAPEGEEMRNSQLAILCGVIFAGAILVAGSNWMAIRSLRQTVEPKNSATASRRIQVAMMPKAKGDPYFISCRKGADEAAAELGVDLLWDGPTDLDPAKQNEVVESWITKGVDVIAVSVENRAAISTVLRKARAKGIKVLAWDADAEADARDFLINQATPQGIGDTITDQVAEILGGKGEFAIVTGSLSAANQNEWMKFMRQRLAAKYPGIKLVAVQPSDSDRDRAFSEAQSILKVYPNVKAIAGISAPAVPGVAEAVKQSGRSDVKVTGLSLPNLCKPYVHAGVAHSIVLWNTKDLGYLTVYAAQAVSAGTLKAGSTQIQAGRLGRIEVRDDNVLLGAPFVFTKENIDRFDF